MIRKLFILIAKWNSAIRLVAIAVTAVAALIVCLPAVARADDVADVRAAEMAFNAAENAGDTNGMFKYLLPDRTVYGPVRLVVLSRDGLRKAGNVVRPISMRAGRLTSKSKS